MARGHDPGTSSVSAPQSMPVSIPPPCTAAAPPPPTHAHTPTPATGARVQREGKAARGGWPPPRGLVCAPRPRQRPAPGAHSPAAAPQAGPGGPGVLPLQGTPHARGVPAEAAGGGGLAAVRRGVRPGTLPPPPHPSPNARRHPLQRDHGHRSWLCKTPLYALCTRTGSSSHPVDPNPGLCVQIVARQRAARAEKEKERAAAEDMERRRAVARAEQRRQDEILLMAIADRDSRAWVPVPRWGRAVVGGEVLLHVLTPKLPLLPAPHSPPPPLPGASPFAPFPLPNPSHPPCCHLHA